MGAIILQILTLLGGLLGEYIAAFLRNWEANHSGDNALLDYVAQLVESAEQNPALKDGDARYAWVFNTATSDFFAQGKQIGTSMLNTLIELALQKLKAVELPNG